MRLWNHPAGRLAAAALVVSLALASAASAQAVQRSRELVVSGLGFVDDIEVTPQGDLLIALPAAGTVIRRTPLNSTSVLANGVVHGMALEPSGQALWIGEFNTGELRRIDLASGLVTRTIQGFEHPLEITFDGPTTMYVGSLLTQNFFSSPGRIRRLDFPASGTGAPASTIITNAVTGGMDVEVNSEGRLFVTSLGSTTFDEILPNGQVVPVIGPLWQPADLLKGPGTTLYVSTLLIGEIVRADPSLLTGPSLTQLTAILPGLPGPGCEDMAFDLDGQILVSTQNGEVWRYRVRGELVQEGIGYSGLPFAVRIDIPSNPQADYIVTSSLGLGVPIPVPGTSQVFLPAPDILFYATFERSSSFLFNHFGTLDATGKSVVVAFVPVLPTGLVFDIYFGSVLLNNGLPIAVPDVLQVQIFT